MPFPARTTCCFSAAFANLNTHAATKFDFNDDTRAPLLLIGGSKDRVVPASVVHANFSLFRKSKAVTEYHDYPERSHYTLGQDGWEEVANYALEWAVNHSSKADTAKLVNG